MPYHTPDDIPEGTDCRPLFIPNSTQWLAIVSGALTELLKEWNWEQDAGISVEDAIARVKVMIEEYYDGVCGECELPEGGRIIRINGIGEYEELSGGEWVEPTGDYELPPIPVREEPTADERICLAAANATNVFKQLYENLTDSYNLDLDPAVAFTSWVGTTSTVILVAIGFLSFSVGTILFGFWTLLYQAMEFLTEDVWDEDMDSKFKCALILAATDTDGVVTFDWKQFLDNIAFNTDLGDPSVGELRMFGQVAYMLQILGADGLNQAGATTAITEANCDECNEGWCYRFDFRDNDGGWTTDASAGMWVSGEGWQSVVLSGTSPALLVGGNLDFPNSLRSVMITYTQVGAVNAHRRAYYRTPSYTPLTILQTVDNGTDVSTFMLEDTTTVDIPNFWFNWTEDATPATNVFTLHAIEFRGDFDPNPFGDDNCEV